MVTVFVIIGLFISAVSSQMKLPAEPSLPSAVCSSLSAHLTQAKGLLPESAEASPDTKRIQEALHACSAGHAIKLTDSGGMNAFLSGPLTLPSGVTLWIDKGVTLFASRNPRDFDKTTGSKTCGVLASKGDGCHALITATNTKKSGVVGEGIIDGRGGSTMTGESKTWWDLGLESKNDGGSQNNPRLIQIDGGSDFTLHQISLHNAPKFHVVPSGVNGFIAWGVKIHTPTSTYPKYDSTTAKNTDGIDPAGSSNVVIAHSYINTGDDNVAIKGGSAPTSNVLIAHNHFYKGHGMSIGSETNSGVKNVVVLDLTLDGTDNGIRIKSDASRGGHVSGVTYEQVCMHSVGSPLVFDAHYSSSSGSLYPDFQNITLKDVHIISSTKKEVVFRGYNDKYPVKVTLDNVVSDIALSKVIASNAEITEGPGAVTNVPVTTSSGTNVKLHGTAGKSTAIDCSKAFVPFPS